MQHSSSMISAPKFPQRREDFDQWRKIMKAYLVARELYYDGVITDESSSQQGMSDGDKSKSGNNNINNDNKITKELRDKRNAAYSILLSSFGKDQLKLVMNDKFDGDAMAVWNVMLQAYGTLKSVSTQSLLFSKLTTVTKNKTELIEQYIARVDNIISDLNNMGTIINAAQHKYHLMNGLSKLDEWTLCVEYISQHDINDSLTLPEIYKLLINEETKRRVKSEKNNITKHHDDAIALYNNHNHKFNNKHGHTHNNNKHNNRNKNENERTPASQVPNICWHYNSEEGCKNGDTCKFAHIELCKYFA
jgi:hypothetical protein